MAQQESGTLAAPSIDPAWRQIELITEKSICGYCKQEFQPKKFKQAYCSNLCGDKARGEEIVRQNKIKAEIRKREEQALKEAGMIL